MNAPLKLHHVPPSPHNIKVRVALAYKGIDYESLVVDGQNREALIRLSGQPLAPVIEHGDRVLFDSAAILRYLDANFRDGPRLFSSDIGELKEIEAWDRHHWSRIGPPMGKAFGVYFSGEERPALLEEASRELTERSEKLERHLEGREWIVGDRMTCADILNGCFLLFGCFDERQAAAHPMWTWFREHLHLGSERQGCRDLAQRVASYLSESEPAP